MWLTRRWFGKCICSCFGSVHFVIFINRCEDVLGRRKHIFLGCSGKQFFHCFHGTYATAANRGDDYLKHRQKQNIACYPRRSSRRRGEYTKALKSAVLSIVYFFSLSFYRLRNRMEWYCRKWEWSGLRMLCPIWVSFIWMECIKHTTQWCSLLNEVCFMVTVRSHAVYEWK